MIETKTLFVLKWSVLVSKKMILEKTKN